MKDQQEHNYSILLVLKSSILIFGVLIFVAKAFSQDRKSNRNISVLPVPAIGYSPETKTYLGAVTLFTFKNLNDSLSRSSNAKVEFNYTWNKQIIVESGWNYFSAKEKWFTRGLLHYSKYPDLYYGIGYETSGENEVSFQSNRIMFETDVFRNWKNKMFVGAGVSYKSYGNIKYPEEGISYPELKNSTDFGLKVIFLKDARNNILSASNGNYFELGNSFNFADSFYSVTTFDFRKYAGFGKNDNQTLAGRIYHSTVWGKPPFYDYAEIGGDKLTRGYYQGRFRESNFSTIQLEFRSKLFWRFGIATFGGISALYKNPGDIQNESFKPNVGAGIRFLVDKSENTNLRIDYAIGADNQSGFYVSFGESF